MAIPVLLGTFCQLYPKPKMLRARQHKVDFAPVRGQGKSAIVEVPNLEIWVLRNVLIQVRKICNNLLSRVETYFSCMLEEEDLFGFL